MNSVTGGFDEGAVATFFVGPAGLALGGFTLFDFEEESGLGGADFAGAAIATFISTLLEASIT